MKTSDVVVMLKGCAYNLWTATLCAGPQSIHDLFEELRSPKPGDLVMETTTHGMKSRDPLEGIGRLVSITEEPTATREEWKAEGGSDDDEIPTSTVYTIELIFDDGRMFRWRNATFIKVKTGSLRDESWDGPRRTFPARPGEPVRAVANPRTGEIEIDRMG